MRKIFFALAMLMTAMAAQAQFNLQFHYDMGRQMNGDKEENRQQTTVTAEFFRADALGSTYLFIDMDLLGSARGEGGMLGAYTEIGRDFTFATIPNSNSSFTAHVEFDAGQSKSGGVFQTAGLVGPAYQWHSNDFSRTFTLQVLYKHFFKSAGHEAVASFQLTPVWGITFANGLCTFSGFADLWYGYIPKFDADGQKKGMVFLSEPQFWFNVIGKDRQNDKLSIGTEIELSNNFIFPTAGEGSFYCNPTLAVKYTF